VLSPVSAIAFEMQAAKGVFALLLGSGVSRAAKIPTGWDITLDLVRRVAALKGEDPGADPAGWYSAKFGKTPDYSELLDRLATTPALRQQVIRPYIEPTDDERARGEKLPTAAHRAVASLMAKGYVRVVLTTNFDQLLEQAIADLGIKATVISSADHVAGAVPLVHAGPVIVKLHGDYLDTRIRNTTGELSTYEPALDVLLDRVLDEFGLIVCGWSGEWDTALKVGIDRAPSRRYPTIWAARGEPGAAAKALIERRLARIVPIDGADGFFDELAQRVQAIETLRQPHPLSADIAVAMMKDYLPEPRHQIRLQDLINTAFCRLLERLDQPQFAIGAWSAQSFADHVMKYLAAVHPFLPMAYTAGLWCNEHQAQQWVDIVIALARRRRNASGPTPLVDLRAFPASQVLYAIGLGAVIGRRPQLIGLLAGKVVDIGDAGGGNFALGDRLNVAVVITDGGAERFKLLPAYKDKRLPGSEVMADLLRPLAKRELRDAEAFDEAFARLELALALGYAERVVGNRERFWAPPARVAFDGTLREAILSAWRADCSAKALQCEPCVMAALSKPPRFDELEEHLKRFGFPF
jgi:SIR2-like domain